MRVNVGFTFARVYNVDVFDVVKGQKFSLDTNNKDNEDVEIPPAKADWWFSNNDNVLSLTVTGSGATCEATNPGVCTILIMNEGYITLKKIFITVLDAIKDPAQSLNATSDQAPVQK